MRSRSYSSTGRSWPVGLLSDARHLYVGHASDIPTRLAREIAQLHEMQALIVDHFGLELIDRDILDVGAGQRLLQMAYFSKENRVVGIDADVIIQRFSPRAVVKMVAANGFRRATKTLVRKLVGIDRQYRKELIRQVELEEFPHLKVFQMDAGHLDFQDESFDFAYAINVFQHLHDPESAVKEVVRVLRPGGVFFIDLMPFTGKTGALDIRMLSGRGEMIPAWAHLRPQFAGEIRESAYVNRLRVAEWIDLFQTYAPGCKFLFQRPDAEAQRQEVERLWTEGELREYELEELLTMEIFALWQKAP